MDSSEGRVAVIGAGISGLLSAYYLAKEPRLPVVDVFEARVSPGKPHCTGIVSAETARRLPLAEKVVLARYNSLVLMIPELKLSVLLTFDHYAAVRLDRIALERRLSEQLQLAGVRILYGSPVRWIRHVGGGWQLESRATRSLYDYLVLASGYGSRLSRPLGLSCVAEPLAGAQVDVEVGSRSVVKEDAVVVVLSNRIGGFAWLAPAGERVATVGCAADPRVITSVECLRRALMLIERLAGGVRPVSEVYGGVVLRGYPVRIVGNRVAGIGDSVAMVKSLSGGGLYGISIAARLIPMLVLGRSSPRALIRALLKKLKSQYYLAKALTFAIRIAEAARFTNRSVRVHVGRYVSYDDHLELLLGVLLSRKLPTLVSRRSVEISDEDLEEALRFLRCPGRT